MSRNPTRYTKADQFSNLSRQEKRIPIDNDEMDETYSDEIINQTNLDTYHDGIDEFQNLPRFLKPIFTKLAKKHASLKCRLINNAKKLQELDNYQESGNIPKSVKFQIKSFEKRYTDVETITRLSDSLIQSEKSRLTNQNDDTNDIINGRSIELEGMLKPIIENSNLFKAANLNAELILDSLIESEFCTMLLKMENDNYLKEQKKVKFLLQKSEKEAPVAITKQQMQQLNKKIKSLELKLHESKKSSKNLKGKPGMKKPGKPNPKGKGKGTKSKYSKGNGSTKSTRKDLQ